MKVCILTGSPRANSNTSALLEPVVEVMEQEGAACDILHLHSMNIGPCTACRACQQDWSVFGCPQQDDLQQVFDGVMACDLLVLATPIYAWYCTPPMKAVLDRLVYGMNKFYGEKKGPALWAGKSLALVTTCGYRPEKGADLWEEGMRRYCKHSQLRYLGILAERHMGYHVPFMDGEKAERAEVFAKELMKQMTDKKAGV